MWIFLFVKNKIIERLVIAVLIFRIPIIIKILQAKAEI